MRFPVRLFSFRSQEALSDAYNYFRRSYKGQVEMRTSKTGGIFPYFLVLVKSVEADEDVICSGLQELGSRGNWYEDSFHTTIADVALYLNRRLWPFTALNSWTGGLSIGLHSWKHCT